MFENATGDKGMLESDGALHVRATVVDSGGDGKELIVDSPSLLVVLSFTGVEELKEKFGSDTAVTDEHTVDVESGVEEVFVVASEDVGVGSCLPDDGDLSVPSSHISDTILHGEDTGLGKDIELGLQVVSCLSVVGVLEEDEGETRGLVDLLVTNLGGTGLVAESEPSVRRVEQTRSGTSLPCALRLETSNVVTFSGDTGNDGDLVVDRLDKSLDDLCLLLRGEEGTLTGVAENDQTLDTVDGRKPRSDTLDSLVVDRAVLVERSDGSGSDTTHVEADSASGVRELGNVVGETVGGHFESSDLCCSDVCEVGVVWLEIAV